jgi:hypothetical protein
VSPPVSVMSKRHWVSFLQQSLTLVAASTPTQGGTMNLGCSKRCSRPLCGLSCFYKYGAP